ncbi:hypothetical protein E3N88_09708 [Mikania micrantha]|uniref:Disease resistance protein Roq1-like winged-helix domain-containing protein n=1 Tax=Mikania micrantha TaxID=192012 RepID=A0A5N6PKI0_9ASTR|nr:hypothetical protein E3N88_09708 [Mikania micrantha]
MLPESQMKIRSKSGFPIPRGTPRENLRGGAMRLGKFKTGSSFVQNVMPHRNVLVVLDDVDGIDQLEALAPICLFSRRAFRTEFPIQGFEELSEAVVHYAAGLPLTIKVLGSFLCGRTEPIWLETLKRLKKIPLDETLKILEISYDGLEEECKEIFLDIACILKGERKNKAIRILESFGFHAQIGLEVLEQKSLINISYNGYLGMHDHIEEMGKNIVRCLHPNEPNRHSRLWVEEEIKEILINDLVRLVKLIYKVELKHVFICYDKKFMLFFFTGYQIHKKYDTELYRYPSSCSYEKFKKDEEN